MKTIIIFWTDERKEYRQAKRFTDRGKADRFIGKLEQDEHCFNIKEWN